MGPPIRLEVLDCLRESEKTVGELKQELRCSQSMMSHQLQILEQCGLVASRRKGPQTHCSLSRPACGEHHRPERPRPLDDLPRLSLLRGGGTFDSRNQLVCMPTGVVSDPMFFMNAKGIMALTNTKATVFDRQECSVYWRNVKTGEEQSLAYDKLSLATGATPVMPPVPGIDLDGITTLQSVCDAGRTNGIECDMGTNLRGIAGQVDKRPAQLHEVISPACPQDGRGGRTNV